jgi:hypothetical protein
LVLQQWRVEPSTLLLPIYLNLTSAYQIWPIKVFILTYVFFFKILECQLHASWSSITHLRLIFSF